MSKKSQLQKVQIVPKFQLGQLIGHLGSGVVGMVHEVITRNQYKTPQGMVVQQLSEAAYKITYLSNDGIIQLFAAPERFFESAEVEEEEAVPAE